MVQSYEKFSIIVPFRIIFLNYLCKKQQKSGAKGKSLKLLKESGTMFCFLHRSPLYVRCRASSQKAARRISGSKTSNRHRPFINRNLSIGTAKVQIIIEKHKNIYFFPII